MSDEELVRFFKGAVVSPVLTAHPTEVRRKSTIDREMEIAALIDRRERLQLTSSETRANDEELRRAVLTLWKTNLLRRTKLTVLDEVANGLSFYDYTFLSEVPRLHCSLEDHLRETGALSAQDDLPSFLRMGSWIGGDRDGNPFVTADVLRDALHLQCALVMRFYLEELNELGAELSIAADLGDVSGALSELAAKTPDQSPRRVGEPYRLAISGLYARLAATASELGIVPRRPPVAKVEGHTAASEFLNDLDILHRSLVANRCEVIARGRLRMPRKAVDCFGFHLAALDIRQNSAVHERTVAELIGKSVLETGYAELSEDKRMALLCREI